MPSVYSCRGVCRATHCVSLSPVWAWVAVEVVDREPASRVCFYLGRVCAIISEATSRSDARAQLSGGVSLGDRVLEYTDESWRVLALGRLQAAQLSIAARVLVTFAIGTPSRGTAPRSSLPLLVARPTRHTTAAANDGAGRAG